MTDTRYLVHGVFWHGPQPAAPVAGLPGAGRAALRLQDPAGVFTELALDAGTRLGFRLADRDKRCLGHHKVHGPADRDHASCPDRAAAARGNQCGPCFAVDDARLIHDFHRLVAPRAAAALDALNSRLAAGVRNLLGGAGVEGFEVVDERWLRPGLADAACTPAARHAYPHDLGTGAHGFRIDSLSGGVALARLDGADLDFVVNLGGLKARTIELGDHRSGVPAVQEALF